LDVASLSIRVDSRQLSRGQRDLRDFGAQGERTGRQVEAAGGAATRGMRAAALAATAAIGALVSVGAAIRVITSFETSMSRLGAVSRATTGELEQLREVAKQFGATTEFSATQAADGLNFLAMAGFSVADAIAALPSVLDLATVSGQGLAIAADQASNIMSTFGIAATEAASVADTLAGASSRANTNVSELAQAITSVGGVAVGLGMDLTETAAALAVLADNGLKSERAGTALRGVLASLAGPTTSALSALEKYGLSAADINPELSSLSDIMSLLGRSNISTADSLAIFGREAASAFGFLSRGSERLAELNVEFSNLEGSAQEAGASIRDNIGGDFQNASSAAQGLAIALGDAGLTMAIRLVVQGITAIVRGFSDAVDAIGDFRGFVIAAALALTVVYAPAIIAATAATYAWVVSLFAVRGALIATGIGAFIVLAGLFLNKVISLIEQVGGLGDALGLLNQVAVEVFNRIGIAFSIIPQSVTAGADAMKSIFLQAVTDMLGGFLEMIQDVVRTINDTFGTDISAPNLAIDRDIYILNRAAADAATASAARLNATIAEVSAPLKSLEAMREAMVEAEERTAATAAEAAILEAELQAITDQINNGTSGAVTQLADDLNAAAVSADSFANTFKDGITDALDYVLGGMKNGMDGLLDIFKRMLIDMIKFALMNPINLQGGMNIAGMGASAMSGGGSGGGMGAGMLGGLSAALTSGGSLMGVTGLMGGIGAGAGMAGSALLSSGVSGMAGTIGAQVGAATAAGASMAGIGAAIGAVALPLLAISAVVSFFKKKTKLIDSGIRAMIDMENAMFESFQTIQTKKFFGLSKKTNTNFAALSEEESDPLRVAVFEVRDNVLAAADSLGISANVLDGFTSKFTLSLKGLDDAAKEAAVLESLEGLGDEMAALVLGLGDGITEAVNELEKQAKSQSGSKLVRIFQDAAARREALNDTTELSAGAYEELLRLSTALVTVNDVFRDLGFAAFNVSIAGAEAAIQFSDLFGSLEQFATSSALYYDQFFSNEEKLANATVRLTESLAGLGVNFVPDTNKAFRELVETAMLGGDSDLAANLIMLAPAFDAVTDAAGMLAAALMVPVNENAFATGVDFRRGLARASNAIDYTPQQSQAEMLAQLKALNARIDVLQSTSEITANSSTQTAENTDFSNALTLEAAA
jgi:TP901 family phage tail tape measure protein